MSERRYIRDTVADDFKHDWQKELDKREAWLNGVEDVKSIPKGTEVLFYDPYVDGNSLSSCHGEPCNIGGYGE